VTFGSQATLKTKYAPCAPGAGICQWSGLDAKKTKKENLGTLVYDSDVHREEDSWALASDVQREEDVSAVALAESLVLETTTTLAEESSHLPDVMVSLQYRADGSAGVVVPEQAVCFARLSASVLIDESEQQFKAGVDGDLAGVGKPVRWMPLKRIPLNTDAANYSLGIPPEAPGGELLLRIAVVRLGRETDEELEESDDEGSLLSAANFSAMGDSALFAASDLGGSAISAASNLGDSAFSATSSLGDSAFSAASAASNMSVTGMVSSLSDAAASASDAASSAADSAVSSASDLASDAAASASSAAAAAAESAAIAALAVSGRLITVDGRLTAKEEQSFVARRNRWLTLARSIQARSVHRLNSLPAVKHLINLTNRSLRRLRSAPEFRTVNPWLGADALPPLRFATRRLVVHVLQAAGLPPSKANPAETALVDAAVEVSLAGVYATRTLRTAAIHDSSAPCWHEALVFESNVLPCDAQMLPMLKLVVKDCAAAPRSLAERLVGTVSESETLATLNITMYKVFVEHTGRGPTPPKWFDLHGSSSCTAGRVLLSFAMENVGADPHKGFPEKDPALRCRPESLPAVVEVTCLGARELRAPVTETLKQKEQLERFLSKNTHKTTGFAAVQAIDTANEIASTLATATGTASTSLPSLPRIHCRVQQKGGVDAVGLTRHTRNPTPSNPNFCETFALSKIELPEDPALAPMLEIRVLDVDGAILGFGSVSLGGSYAKTDRGGLSLWRGADDNNEPIAQSTSKVEGDGNLNALPYMQGRHTLSGSYEARPPWLRVALYQGIHSDGDGRQAPRPAGVLKIAVRCFLAKDEDKAQHAASKASPVLSPAGSVAQDYIVRLYVLNGAKLITAPEIELMSRCEPYLKVALGTSRRGARPKMIDLPMSAGSTETPAAIPTETPTDLPSLPTELPGADFADLLKEDPKKGPDPDIYRMFELPATIPGPSVLRLVVKDAAMNPSMVGSA
jgi:hypothetical protein